MLMVRKIVLLLVASLTCGLLASAQTKQVSGTVKDANGNAIVGATVIVDGTTIGTNTGTDGSFRISAPANGNLLVSFIGYEDQKIAIAGKTSIEVVLQDNYTAIEGVTVQTFGELKKKDLTGSITAVTAKDLQKMTVSSVSNALEGAVPGIQSYSTTGQPGTDAAIYIRGIGSINGNQAALIVVDGVPYSSALSTINPLDIESVVVSKDAAANALYGSRAANGVIFVTTKKGARNQKANITFEAKWGWNEMGVGEHETMQNPGDYYEYLYGGIYNYFAAAYPQYNHDVWASNAYYNLFNENPNNAITGNYMAYKVPDGETLIDLKTGKLNPNAQLLYADNYDDYLFTKQFRQEYTLSISGGNEKMDYYVSGNFLDDPSYVIMSAFKRYSGRAAVNAQVTNWMKIGTNVSYSRRDTDDPGFGDGANTGNVFLWTMWQTPIVPFYARDLDGNIRYNPDGTKMLENGGGSTLSPYGDTADMFNALNNYANPKESMSRDVNNLIRDNIYANAYVDITFLKDFKFTANFTLDNVYNYSTYYQNNQYGYGTSINGFVQKSVSHYNSYNTQQMLSYTKSINDLHDINVMIGHEFNKTDNNSLAAYKTNIFYPGIPELGNAITPYNEASTSSRVISTLEGYFMRANYSFDDRYSVSASYRYDGSSLFKYDKWGHFWSVGGSWRISQEQFMKNALWVNDLRLRATYGVSGNQLNSAYPYTNLWAIGEADGKPTLSQSSVGNPDLSWERNKQIDLGLDFRLWDRVYGSIDWYNRRTHDLIWNRPTPASTGQTSRLENVGVLQNAGLEFDITVDIIKNRNVYWNIGINGAFAQNKLIEFPEELGNAALGGDYVSGAFLRGKGKSYYNLYLFDYAGVDPETGGELYWKNTTDSDGNVTGRELTDNFYEADQYEMGDALPDMTGGLRTSFRWKNLDINVQTAFQIGGKQWDGASANLYDPGRAMFTVSDDLVGNTWTPDNTGAEFPSLMFNGTWNFPASNVNALYRDASYFSLKNLNVGYTLPQKWTSKLSIESLRIFFNADNLCFVSAHDGFDPRMGFSGMDGFVFPQARTFTFGITLNM